MLGLMSMMDLLETEENISYLLYKACVNVRFEIWQSAFFEMKFKENFVVLSLVLLP